MTIELVVGPDRGAPTAWPVLDRRTVDALDASFARSNASEIVGWATEAFGSRLALTASMADAVLIDLAVRADPGIEVVFIDTGYHFPETLATVEVVRRHYGLNLRIMTVAPHAEELWRIDPEQCCSAVKVGQLDRALATKAAWMSGGRRVEAPTRQRLRVVDLDHRGLVKISPLAAWADTDVADYIERHSVPCNPLLAQGYPSIGCAPCTAPVPPGAEARSGRWHGSDKTECGLHL